jgi:hypothetical protein
MVGYKSCKGVETNEQSASDGYEINEIRDFVVVVTNLEEEDGNTHDVSAIINLID